MLSISVFFKCERWERYKENSKLTKCVPSYLAYPTLFDTACFDSYSDHSALVQLKSVQLSQGSKSSEVALISAPTAAALAVASFESFDLVLHLTMWAPWKSIQINSRYNIFRFLFYDKFKNQNKNKNLNAHGCARWRACRIKRWFDSGYCQMSGVMR